jgi:patatin-like phospholipase/acyl hydrolase
MMASDCRATTISTRSSARAATDRIITKSNVSEQACPMLSIVATQMRQMQQMAANMDPAQMAQMQQMAANMDPAQMRQMQQQVGIWIQQKCEVCHHTSMCVQTCLLDVAMQCSLTRSCIADTFDDTGRRHGRDGRHGRSAPSTAAGTAAA